MTKVCVMLQCLLSMIKGIMLVNYLQQHVDDAWLVTQHGTKYVYIGSVSVRTTLLTITMISIFIVIPCQTKIISQKG